MHRPSTGALIAGAAEVLGHLVLERLLEDQPGAEAADRFNRIDFLVDAVEGGLELAPQALRRGYAGHGCSSFLGLAGQSGSYALFRFPPGEWDGTCDRPS